MKFSKVIAQVGGAVVCLSSLSILFVGCQSQTDNGDSDEDGLLHSKLFPADFGEFEDWTLGDQTSPDYFPGARPKTLIVRGIPGEDGYKALSFFRDDIRSIMVFMGKDLVPKRFLSAIELCKDLTYLEITATIEIDKGNHLELKLPALKTLDINESDVELISLKHLDSLTTLYVSGTSIQSVQAIKCEAMNKVTEIDLSYTPIVSFSENWLQMFPELKDLNMMGTANLSKDFINDLEEWARNNRPELQIYK